jgi:ATP-dependent protease HslVU (ClpYQ) peptidase subunit
MTVCIAVRSQGMLLIASDRMLTAGDIQFEPPIPKMYFLTPSLVVMFSGDANFHSEVLQDLIVDVNKKVEAAPDDWLKVKDVADLYVSYRNAAKRRRAEAAILAPLGLTIDTFMTRQAGMNPEVVARIAGDLVNFPVPSVEVIVCGLDLRLGHALPTIHRIDDGSVSCVDSVGFTAIGSGARHATSRLMLTRLSYLTPNADALIILRSAKMDAEVAPGVGTETDIFAFGPNVANHFKLRARCGRNSSRNVSK